MTSFYDVDYIYIRNKIGNVYVIRHFKHCSTDVNVKVYNSYCCNIYCCALLSVYYKTVFDKLPVSSNNVFKCLIGVPRDFSASALFVNLNVCNFGILKAGLHQARSHYVLEYMIELG